MDECSICLENITNLETSCRLPGCNHLFHTSCILNNVQYDTRCPNCRVNIPDVSPRKNEISNPILSVDTLYEEFRRLRNNYNRKKNRIIKQNEKISNLYKNFKCEYKKLKTIEKKLNSEYIKKTRQLWSEDDELAVMKICFEKLNRKCKRMEKTINQYVENHVGPEPELDADLSSILEMLA